VAGELHRKFGVESTDRETIIRWLRELTQLDEPQIDQICCMLDIDVQRYLAQQRPYLTRGEIRSLQADGFAIGAHGTTHVRLNLLPEEKRDEPASDSTNCPSRTLVHGAPAAPERTVPPTMEHEIVQSCRSVGQWTGRDSVPFAFPFSGDGIGRDRLESLRRTHAEVSLLFDRRGFRPDRDFVVHRIIADASDPATPECTMLPRLIRREYCREARRRFVQAIHSTRVSPSH
jgi:hypothetical protein